MKKIIRFLLTSGLLVLSAYADLFAQCNNVGPVYINSSLDFDVAPNATQVHWTLSGGASTTDNRGGKSIHVLFGVTGTSYVQVTYRLGDDNVVEMCWEMPVVNALNGGTIAGDISVYSKGEILPYKFLKNVTSATGGLNDYYRRTNVYQWEQSTDQYKVQQV
jgi:hypothetical protein